MFEASTGARLRSGESRQRGICLMVAKKAASMVEGRAVPPFCKNGQALLNKIHESPQIFKSVMLGF